MVLCLRLCCNVCQAAVSLLISISMLELKVQSYTSCYGSSFKSSSANQACVHVSQVAPLHGLQLIPSKHINPVQSQSSAGLVNMQDCHAGCTKSISAIASRHNSSKAFKSDLRFSPAFEGLMFSAVHELLYMHLIVMYQ